jgi:hypothetical protein
MNKSDFVEFIDLMADGQEVLDEMVVEASVTSDANVARAEKSASKVNNQGRDAQIKFILDRLSSVEAACVAAAKISDSLPSAFKAIVEASLAVVKSYHRDVFIHDLNAIRSHDGPFLYFCRETGSNIFQFRGWPVDLSDDDKEVVRTFLRTNEAYFHWDGNGLRTVSRALIEKLLSR